MIEQHDLDELEAQLREGRVDPASLFERHHAADVALLLTRIDDDAARLAFFRALDREAASDLLAHLDEPTRVHLLENSPVEVIGPIVSWMDSDDAADLLAEVDEELAARILKAASGDVKEEVTRLLAYDEESAGGLMQTELFSVGARETVAHAVIRLRERSDELDEVHNVFVTDAEGRLQGAVPIRALLLADPQTPVGSLIEEAPVAVTPETDQEEVAGLFARYDLVSLPVVDDDQKLMGRILIDDVVDVLEDEASEDILKMVGAHEEALDPGKSTLAMAWYRFPWLASSLAGGFITGGVIWQFKVTLAEALYLTAFIPLVMGISGNVGSQSSALVIRSIAIGNVPRGMVREYLVKELAVGMLLGLACGLAAGVIGEWWQGEGAIGMILGVSIFVSIVFAALFGSTIPLLFKTINIDPAIAGGPMVLAITDITAVLIFFAVASTLLAMWGG